MLCTWEKIILKLLTVVSLNFLFPLCYRQQKLRNSHHILWVWNDLTLFSNDNLLCSSVKCNSMFTDRRVSKVFLLVVHTVQSLNVYEQLDSYLLAWSKVKSHVTFPMLEHLSFLENLGLLLIKLFIYNILSISVIFLYSSLKIYQRICNNWRWKN